MYKKLSIIPFREHPILLNPFYFLYEVFFSLNQSCYFFLMPDDMRIQSLLLADQDLLFFAQSQTRILKTIIEGSIFSPWRLVPLLSWKLSHLFWMVFQQAELGLSSTLFHRSSARVSVYWALSCRI